MRKPPPQVKHIGARQGGHELIAADLRRRLAAGEWGPGERLMADVAARRLAGCILDMHPGFLGENPLLDTSLPKVALNHDSRRPDIPAISTGSSDWLDQALGWLRERGRRRSAWLGIPTVMPTGVEGFQRAAARHGFETRAGWTHAVLPKSRVRSKRCDPHRDTPVLPDVPA